MGKYKNIFIADTDTVTGIGGPVSEETKKEIFELKQRPESKSLIIMVGSMKQARSLEGWSKKAEEFANEYWPGATTFVLSETVAVRMPDLEPLQELIKVVGPIYMTSANISGQATLTIQEAKEVFKDVEKFYEFGAGSGEPSTIIRVEDKEVIR